MRRSELPYHLTPVLGQRIARLYIAHPRRSRSIPLPHSMLHINYSILLSCFVPKKYGNSLNPEKAFGTGEDHTPVPNAVKSFQDK